MNVSKKKMEGKKGNLIVSIFWVLFWMGFVAGVLIVVVPPLLKSSGHEQSGSHVWVYKSTGIKASNATARDVWRHNNPGKSWDQHQENQALGCSVFLGVALVVAIALLADKLFVFPSIAHGKKLFWQIGGPILGLLLGAIFYSAQNELMGFSKGFLRVLQVVIFVLLGAGLIGAITLHFLDIPIPISHNWLWALIGASFLLHILGAISGNAQKEKAVKGGNKLFKWVDQVMMLTGSNSWDKLDAVMALATYELQMGKFNYTVRSKDFFDQTESLMLDLVSGGQMSIDMDEIYRARTQIIKALQTFYFYAVEHFPEHKMHSKIQKALKK